MAECVPFFKPGKDLPGKANEEVKGCRFAAIVGEPTSGPGLVTTIDGSLYLVGYPDNKGRVVGVFAADTVRNDGVTVFTGGIVPVEAASAIDAGEEVMSDGDGKANPVSGGYAVGLCVGGAAQNGFAQVLLYNGPGGAAVS